MAPRQRVYPAPTTDPAVRAVLRGARRTATPRRPKPKTAAALTRMAARCPGDLAGMRDRALLLLAATGLGRAALVGLDVEHIRFTATAAEFSSRRRATARPAGRHPPRRQSSLCPVQALRDWLATSETRFGPVFRKIDRWGLVEHHRLGTDAIRRILARREPHRRAPGASRASAPNRPAAHDRRPAPAPSAVTATQAAAKASEAADAVLAWLQTQSGRIRPHPEASEHAAGDEREQPLAATSAAAWPWAGNGGGWISAGRCYASGHG